LAIAAKAHSELRSFTNYQKLIKDYPLMVEAIKQKVFSSLEDKGQLDMPFAKDLSFQADRAGLLMISKAYKINPHASEKTIAEAFAKFVYQHPQEMSYAIEYMGHIDFYEPSGMSFPLWQWMMLMTDIENHLHQLDIIHSTDNSHRLINRLQDMINEARRVL